MTSADLLFVSYALMGFGIFILAVAMSLSLLKLLDMQKSKGYRKYITNMYVAGRIRQMAEADKIDIPKEEEGFLKYDALSKKDRLRDLDDKIEQELAERISKEKLKNLKL